MKFVEIAIPRNKDVDSPERPEKIIINLAELVEASVIPIDTINRINMDSTHALVLTFSATEISLHGTKKECQECYEALCAILKSEKPIKGSKFVVSALTPS